MIMPGRSYTSGSSSYRFGFNGKENDNEVKGEGNQQDYGMRIYDPRLGRFLSEDPLVKKFPMLTPYQFASNNPVWNIDIDGLEGGPANQTGLEYIVRIMDRDGIIKNDPAGTKYKYSTTESTLPHQDIFKISGTVTTGTITMDQSGPCCPTIVRAVTYRDVSPKGSTEPRLVLWKFDEKIDGPRNPPQVVAMPPQIQNIPIPAAGFNPANGLAGRSPGAPDPTQLTAAGQAAVNTTAATLLPTTTAGAPVVGTNAAGIPTSSVTTTATTPIVTVNVSTGTFAPGATPAAVNNLLRGRMNSIVNTLVGAGIPRANIVPGAMTPGAGISVNLNVTINTTQTTTTTTNCPSSSGCSPPPTDINRTWQR